MSRLSRPLSYESRDRQRPRAGSRCISASSCLRSAPAGSFPRPADRTSLRFSLSTGSWNCPRGQAGTAPTAIAIRFHASCHGKAVGKCRTIRRTVTTTRAPILRRRSRSLPTWQQRANGVRVALSRSLNKSVKDWPEILAGDEVMAHGDLAAGTCWRLCMCKITVGDGHNSLGLHLLEATMRWLRREGSAA